MALPTGGHGVPDSFNVPYIFVHDDGLETYDTRSLQGLQMTPAELHVSVAPEALPGLEKEAYESRPTDPCSNKTPVLKSSILPKKRQSWKFWLSVIAGAWLIIAIATAVPLGLHYSRDSSHSRPSAKPVELASNASANPILPTSGTSNVSNLTPQTLSTSGAFNGTSLATFHSGINQELVTHLFYQDYRGQLRRIEKDGSQWSGGPAIPAVVASNAKNATPLACANYTDPATNAQKANLFYVDPTNVLQEVISTDNFQTWKTGTLGNSVVEISPSAFAMTTFYSGESGLRLYYGGVDGLVHEIIYSSGDGIWSGQFRFQSSKGNGGICHSLFNDNPGLAQIYVLDAQNNIRLWNLTITPTAISNWTLDPSPADVTSAAVNSTLAYGSGWLCFQEESGAISAVQTYQSLSQSGWGGTLNLGLGMPEIALPRPAIAAAAVFVGDNLPMSLDIWYQPKGNEIMESLDLAGTFNLTLLPV